MKGFQAVMLLAIMSLTGCASTPPATNPKSTSDAVRDLTVVLAGQCHANAANLGTDFKTCFNHQLDAAVEQVREYQKCVSPVGCQPL